MFGAGEGDGYFLVRIRRAWNEGGIRVAVAVARDFKDLVARRNDEHPCVHVQ